MNVTASTLSIATLTACLTLGACSKSTRQAETPGLQTDPPEASTAPETEPEPEEPTSPAEEPSLEEEITELKNDIRAKEQNIEDLEAAVRMEQAKLQDDPGYDQSFLNDVLQEQERDWLEIEKARDRINALSGAEE